MRLRIVSYNIHRAIGSDRRFRPERVADILDSHRADLILLQEVDHGVPRSRRMNMARFLADRLGYGSEAAFSRAFKRTMGEPPGAVRRRPESPVLVGTA